MSRVIMLPDQRMNNAATYKFMREDHTLGNLLRIELLRDPMVRYAGYQIPHPLEHDLLVRVQTTKRTTPTEAVMRACERLSSEFRHIARAVDDKLAALAGAGLDDLDEGTD